MDYYISITARLESLYNEMKGKFRKYSHHKFHKVNKRSIHFTVLPLIRFSRYDDFDSFEVAGKHFMESLSIDDKDIPKQFSMIFYEIIWYESGICFQLREEHG